ncbi:MAG: methylated-DNA--[protein]-cysteine S-methyltransferase, partial [Acidimicrobiales bacterium]
AADGVLDGACRQLVAYLAGELAEVDVAVDWARVGALVGPFGLGVLEACARIPAGQVRTYAQVAAAAGAPRAARAVGNALAANPVPIVVPCHRVVLAGGGLGGYAGGPDTKASLLALEAGGLNDGG